MNGITTEIIQFDPNDLLKSDDSQLKQLVEAKTAVGISRQSWGRTVDRFTEEAHDFLWYTDWESLEHHKKADLGDIAAELNKLSAKQATTFKVAFTPFEGYTKSLKAPVTEVIIARLKPGQDIQKFENINEVSLVAAGEDAGCLGWAWGKDVDNENTYILMFGWTSIEAHSAFCATESFKVTTDPWLPFVSKAEVYYIHFENK